MKKNEEQVLNTENDEEVTDINLTNQLIGEVQGFIFIMRWFIYEFYSFKQLKSDGLLQYTDFEALEDDLLYTIHQVTVQNGVYDTLLVLSRLLNNRDDKKIRDKYKQIEKHHSKFFPIQMWPEEDLSKS